MKLSRVNSNPDGSRWTTAVADNVPVAQAAANVVRITHVVPMEGL
jgi:hypothetical protein